MNFSDTSDNYFSNIHNSHTSEFDEKIIILKRVKSIRQLRNGEKELVRLLYKQAILRGLVLMEDIQYYILSKSKIMIERSGLEYLKKTEVEENKRWYYYLARDHFAYIGVYRKAIDEVEQCKKELWSMMMGPNTTNMEKVQTIKELHNLTKTSTLLLRDLPFVMSLSKYYDLELIDPKHNKHSEPQDSSTNWNNDDKKIIEQRVSERLRNIIIESALFNPEQKRKMGIISPPPKDGDKNIDDEIMVEMQKQLNCNIEDTLESINNKDYQESIRRLKEIRED